MQDLFQKFWQGEAGPLRAAGVLLDEHLTEWNPAGIKALAYAAFIAGIKVGPEFQAFIELLGFKVDPLATPTVEEILNEPEEERAYREDIEGVWD